MPHLSMLVTPDGRWVSEGSPDFLEALGDPAPDYDATLFAVKNLGFIKFQLFEASIVEIELHPRNVELPALLAVQQQLLTSGARLFRIRHLDTTWTSEIMASAEQAAQRLSRLCAPVLTISKSERFDAEPLDFSEVFAEGRSIMRPLAQKWRASFALFDPTVISLAIEYDLLPHMMVFGLRPRAPEPVFRFVGSHHTRWLGNDSQLSAVGEKVTSQPDKDYGQWVSQFYQAAANTGQPRYDIVKAAIQKGGDSCYMTRYERLLLPWRTTSDEIFVTMCSKRLEEVPSKGSASANDSSSSMKLLKSS